MDLGELQHTRKLWVEELRVHGKKTEITQGKINRLDKYIDRIYAAYSRASKIEEDAGRFIDSF